MRDASVQFNKIRKVFRDSHSNLENVAVQDFSLNIKKGEFITLLGPSGCGKTTVLRMLAGFETPTSGEILVNGKNVTDIPPNKRNLTMVFQSYALFPHMSVEENVAYGLKLRKIPKNEQADKLKRVFKMMNLIGYEKRRPFELSGGQQQRVALARAIVVEPDILLFDEPLSNLDAKLRESMRIELKNLQQKLHITSVYVTHDQAEAMALADRIVVMNKGCIEQVASPEEMYSHPASEFVADFFGAANFLKAEVLSTSSSETGLQWQNTELNLPASRSDIKAKDIVTVVARPEYLTLQQASPNATIRSTIFLGSHYEVELKTSNDQILLAKIAKDEWKPEYVSGASVQVGFKTSFLHVL